MLTTLPRPPNRKRQRAFCAHHSLFRVHFYTSILLPGPSLTEFLDPPLCRRILIQALVISRLDYCNSVLSGLPSSTLQPLSSVLHTAARLIKDLSPIDHITPILKQLHWLPIHARIAFKISLLMYHIHSGTSPSYMSSMVTPCSAS